MLSVSRDTSASPGAVWDLLIDPSQWPIWGPTIRDVRSEDRRIALGSTGEVQVGPAWLPFEVVEFEPEHYWRWKVGGVPATGHRVERRSRGSRVIFEVPALAAPYLAVCALACRRLAKLASKH